MSILICKNIRFSFSFVVKTNLNAFLTINPVDKCIVLSELIIIIRVTIGYTIRKLFDILPNGSKYFDVSKFPINPKILNIFC